MSEDLKTIKELADEIGVSKQAVWQKIKKESSIDLRQKKEIPFTLTLMVKKLLRVLFYFFLAFPKVFGRVLGEKKTPEKIGCDCKIKKVPRKRHLYYNIYFWLFHNHF